MNNSDFKLTNIVWRR